MGGILKMNGLAGCFPFIAPDKQCALAEKPEILSSFITPDKKCIFLSCIDF